MSSIATFDASMLLRGKLSVNDFYMGVPFPEPSKTDISEFELYKSTLRDLFDSGILVSIDENTVGAVDPKYLMMKNFRNMTAKIPSIPDVNADHIPDSVIDSADL